MKPKTTTKKKEWTEQELGEFVFKLQIEMLKALRIKVMEDLFIKRFREKFPNTAGVFTSLHAREMVKQFVIEALTQARLEAKTHVHHVKGICKGCGRPVEEWKSDLLPFKHGEESTHWACAEMINAKGDTKCCICTGHVCQKEKER